MKTVIVMADFTSLGGAELNLLEIMRYLKDRGNRLYFVSRKSGALFNQYEALVDGVLLTSFAYPSKPISFLKLPVIIYRFWKFFRQVGEGDKVLFVSDVYPLWLAVLLKRIFKVKVVSMWQGEYVFDDDSCVKKWLRYGASNADKLVASPPVANHANSNGLKVDALTPSSNLDRFKRKNVNETRLGPRVAICVGQVDEGKGQRWLVEQYLNNPGLKDNWDLVIVGPIKESEASYWESIKLKGVKILGRRDDVPELLKGADLAIFPGTANESFGLAVVEAALMETPVLALNSGAIGYNLGIDYPGLFDKKHKADLVKKWEGLTDADLLELKVALPSGKLRTTLSRENFEKELEQIF